MSHYPAESLDNGFFAVMSGTRRKVTMQGLGNPVSAIGSDVKAGPPSSSSCDRRSTLVDTLANVDHNATRNIVNDSAGFHICNKNPDIFCYVCCKYVVNKTGRQITDTLKKKYKDCFGSELVYQNTKWVPHTICNSCQSMLYKFDEKNPKNVIKYSKPASWSRPRS